MPTVITKPANRPRRFIPPKPKSTKTPLLPWDKTDAHLPPTATEFAQGPDLAPLVQKMKEEYPSVSQTSDYKESFTRSCPLTSVIITTYNNSNYLMNISLKSILNQTYKNIQIIVVADHSTDDTDIQISKIKDTRLTYINLPTRTNYPGNTRRDIWLIAGTVPINLGISKATGDFITFCDQDDSFTPDKIEKLVQFSQENQCDFIHHPFYVGSPGKITQRYNSEDLCLGKVTTSAVFHHHWFNQIPWDINCWKIDEPGDWNRFKKFKEIGAKFLRYPEFLTYKG